MINLEKALHCDPAEMARLFCFLCHDCVNCPVSKPDGPDISQEACRRKLYQWLMGQEDFSFWEYILGEKDDGENQ